jgi:hypothetical protein
MNPIRLAVCVAALAATVATLPVSARSLGGFSINTRDPPVGSPGPWGGVYLCTAHLRRWNAAAGRWDYHMASGYSASACMADAQIYFNAGYSTNPNPGTGFCTCHEGFSGFMIASPPDDGPLGVNELSPEATQVYSEGLIELRKKYHFDEMVKEHDELLQAVEAADGQGG